MNRLTKPIMMKNIQGNAGLYDLKIKPVVRSSLVSLSRSLPEVGKRSPE